MGKSYLFVLKCFNFAFVCPKLTTPVDNLLQISFDSIRYKDTIEQNSNFLKQKEY